MLRRSSKITVIGMDSKETRRAIKTKPKPKFCYSGYKSLYKKIHLYFSKSFKQDRGRVNDTYLGVIRSKAWKNNC